MITENLIDKYLQVMELEFIPEIKYRPLDNTIILCILEAQLSERVASKKITKRQILNIEKELAQEFEANVVTIFSKKEEDLFVEIVIQNKLLARFQGDIFNVFTSFVGEKVEITIDANPITVEKQEEIVGFLELLNDEGGFDLVWQFREVELPSIAYVLSRIKIKQPIKVEGLVPLLKGEYEQVTEAWLNNSLDALRKKGLIIRNRNGNFAITYKALDALPVTHNRNSLDVKRALELGRRTW